MVADSMFPQPSSEVIFTGDSTPLSSRRSWIRQVIHVKDIIVPSLVNNLQDSGIALFPVLSPSNKDWNHEISPFRLPPRMHLMLADVDAGSDTPSLVGKVLKWRRENVDDGEEEIVLSIHVVL